VGVTIHGVRSIDEARDAFHALVSALEPELRERLVSYGLLLDDLDVYRAIVNRRPVGVIHPQSRAARALADVARLLLGDAAVPAVAEERREAAGRGRSDG
jgi:MinD-like ATPase involved in chromosome partitioning or flagellar assembly